MIVRIYRTQGTFSRSILYAELVAEIEAKEPEDPQALADEYGGDFIQLAPQPYRRGKDAWQSTA